MGSVIIQLGISTVIVGGLLAAIISRSSDSTEALRLTAASVIVATGGIVITLIGGVHWLLFSVLLPLSSK